MLVPVVVYEDGVKGIVKINPFHVVKISFVNPKNVDKGTVILLRTGEEVTTPDPFDIVDQRFEDVMHRSTALLFQQIVTEYASQIKKPRRKTTTRKR